MTRNYFQSTLCQNACENKALYVKHKKMKICYKNLVYQYYEDISLIELNFKENKIIEIEDFILKLSDFVELIGNKRPKFVLFNKYEKNIEIETDLEEFIHQRIFNQIIKYGVKKIFFLAVVDNFSINNDRKDIITLRNMDEIYNLIKKF